MKKLNHFFADLALVIFSGILTGAANAGSGGINSESKECMSHAKTTSQILGCIDAKKSRVNEKISTPENELDSKYKELISMMSGRQANLFNESQRKWVEFRDREFLVIDSALDELRGVVPFSSRQAMRDSIVKARLSQLDAMKSFLHEKTPGRRSVIKPNPYSEKLIVDVGNYPVQIEIPKGFVDARDEFPEMWSFMRKTTVGNSSLAIFFADKKSVRDLKNGIRSDVAPYLSVRYPNENKDRITSKFDFMKLVVESNDYTKKSKDLSTNAALRDFISKMNVAINEEGEKKSSVAIERIKQVSVDEVLEDRFSYTQLAVVSFKSLEGVEETKLMTQTSSIVLIKGRIVMMSMVDAVTSEVDVDDNRWRALSWSDATIKSNLDR
jgi:uncharacterized protein YecT (DUF1311 family)